MTKHMLIDATHPEETRVVVVSGKRLEEFDVEIASRKQLKGNIYLAKVVRVEPSLQAAFVDYGGNRHGFLAFNEIHPDYYRIPMADREALQAELEAQAARNSRDDPEIDPIEPSDRGGSEPSRIGVPLSAEDAPDAELSGSADYDAGDTEEIPALPALGEEETEHRPSASEDSIADDGLGDDDMAAGEEPAVPLERSDLGEERLEGPLVDAAEDDYDAEDRGAAEGMAAETNGAGSPLEENADELPGTPVSGGVEQHAAVAPERLETLGGDEADEEREEPRRPRSIRRYKIQEVIKRRQIMLVQVTKEERGNKGAALTTYLSLAGRYCVLMPNTARGGGISRKITSANDRKRLKSLVGDLDIPRGMAVIVRTAGSERSKAEIKRDYEYLLRLWNEIRDLTLRSTAPALIYEEANLIKRSIRDLYTKDIDDITVEGEEGYKTAKAFMKTLTPSHARRVQAYRDPALTLFQRHQIEAQLDAMHNPVVQLRSGGYIVINQTEALVSIDVNSGRATRERNIEDTALKTNLEAADEIARQLRLRDLAGLVVIDFIDMEEHRHNAQVERRLKEAMRFDRARIQLGRISPFGLLELSRQRLRPSLFEASTETCRFCRGTGRIRSTESTSLHVLRAIEEEGSRRRGPGVAVAVPGSVALYILNQKRRKLSEIESRHGFRVYLTADDTLIAPDFRVDRLRALAPGDEPPPPALPMPAPPPEEPDPEEAQLEAEADEDLDEAQVDPATDRDSPQPDYGMPRMADEGDEEDDRRDHRHGDDRSHDRGDRGDFGDRGERGGRRRRRRRRRGGTGGHPQDGHRHDERGGQMQASHGHAHHHQDRPRQEHDQDHRQQQAEPAQAAGEVSAPAGEPGGEEHPAAQGGDQQRRRRRRGRRGGRRRSRRNGHPQEDNQEGQQPQGWSEDGSQPAAGERPAGEPRYPFATPANPWGVTSDENADEEPGDAEGDDDTRGNRLDPTDDRDERSEEEKRGGPAEEPQAFPAEPEREPATGVTASPDPEPIAPPSEPAADPAPRRRGWWRRRE